MKRLGRSSPSRWQSQQPGSMLKFTKFALRVRRQREVYSVSEVDSDDTSGNEPFFFNQPVGTEMLKQQIGNTSE